MSARDNAPRALLGLDVMMWFEAHGMVADARSTSGARRKDP